MNKYDRMMKEADKNPYCPTCIHASISKQPTTFVGNYLERHLVKAHGYNPRRHWWQIWR